MTRHVTIPATDVIEDINNLQIHPDTICFMVGKCNENGVFIVPQQFETFTIKEELFLIFMAAHPAGFVKDDLWEYVDILRSGADMLRPSPYAVWNKITLAWDEPDNIIELTQNDALKNIDTAAGQARLKYITVAPGQELTYTAKLADATAYIEAGYPEDASPFVWVNAEADATGATPRAVADLIIGTAQAWGVVGANIEGARRAAKLAITAAVDIDAIRAAEQAFIVEQNP